ncbi:unnamed protein product [Ranitomeya imitator]|uniref:Uncharacterized protein n=1 Tax=Ranitomeya imitator TaxID=111125 RepID=A0ABN9KV16_9NEOB|nr:unnamed protein product [Ranitomeya imitator]
MQQKFCLDIWNEIFPRTPFKTLSKKYKISTDTARAGGGYCFFMCMKVMRRTCGNILRTEPSSQTTLSPPDTRFQIPLNASLPHEAGPRTFSRLLFDFLLLSVALLPECFFSPNLFFFSFVNRTFNLFNVEGRAVESEPILVESVSWKLRSLRFSLPTPQPW